MLNFLENCAVFERAKIDLRNNGAKLTDDLRSAAVELPALIGAGNTLL